MADTPAETRRNRGETSYAVRTSSGGEKRLSQLSLRKAMRTGDSKPDVERDAFVPSEVG